MLFPEIEVVTREVESDCKYMSANGLINVNEEY